jgi:hypothetical protein
MALNLNTIKGQLRPIKDHVIVEAMHFGELKVD